MNDIAEKIKKLIAKADSTTSAHEADTFMAKANQLLEANGITMLELGTIGEDAVGTDRHSLYYNNQYTAARDVIFALSRYFGCRAVTHSYHPEKQGRTSARSASIVGRESARITVALMWPYVLRSMRKESRRLKKEEGLFTEQNYLGQIARAMAHRLRILTVEKEAGNPDLYNAKGANALVPVDVIDYEMEKEFGELHTVGSAKGGASASAVKAAAGINVNRQMHGGTVKKLSNG